MRTIEESFALHEYMSACVLRSAVVVGGGYIGLEMADALTLRGIAVTMVEYGASVTFKSPCNTHTAVASSRQVATIRVYGKSIALTNLSF